MCLQIYCNGNDRGKGKYLGIFVYLLKGEHDHFLHWPFYGSITVEVRNLLKNVNHYVHTITFNDRSDAGTRVVGESLFQSKSCGYWNFMPLSVLFPLNFFSEYHYIKNGCLRIDVSSVQVFARS